MTKARFRQKVAGKLPRDEVIKGKVVVKSTHYPVTVRVDSSSIVQVQPVSVTVTHGIKPIARLVFAIARAGQQLFNQSSIGAFAAVGQVVLKLLRLRWKPRKNQSDPSSDHLPISFRREIDSAGGEFSLHKRVNGVTHSGSGNRSFDRPNESPVQSLSLIHI